MTVLKPALKRLCIALMLGGCVIGHAQSQVYERTQPKLPQANTPPSVTPTPPPEVAQDADTKPVIAGLVGLTFVSGTEALVTQGLAPGPDAINVAQVPELNDAEFRATLTPFLGKPTSLADLEKIRILTLNWLRSHQRPFVEVSIPQQNVTSGVVQVVVTQYRLGSISVTGANYFSPDFIRTTSGLEPGQTLVINELQADLDRLNRNPFLSVNAVFSPGARTGETDVALNAVDRLPLRVYSGFDNLGSPSLGLGEYYLGVNWGNAFGMGQVLSYQFSRAVSGDFTAHSVSDAIPLPWNDQILLFGSYEVQKPFLADIFNSVGHSGQAGLRYIFSLPRTMRFTQDLQLGFDFKTTDNNLDFAGFRIFSSAADVDQFSLIYDATLTDSLGQTVFVNALVFSPGNITANNTTEAMATFVPGAQADYVYDRLLVTRSTRLPYDLSAITRLTFQISNHNLMYSEQLSGGGIASVRGYRTGTTLGSQGVMLSQELRSPAFSPLDFMGTGLALGDQAQFGIFFDYAHLSQVTPIPDGPSDMDISSAGILARYSIARFLDVQFNLGFPLRSTPTQRAGAGFGQISVTVGY